MSFARTPRLGDLVGGLVTVGFGSAVLMHVRTFPQLPGGQPGPALFPGIVGALMIVFGCALAVQSFRTPHTVDGAAGPSTGVPATADPAVTTTSVPPRRAVINAATVLGGVVCYILVADLLGYIPTMVVLLTALMWRLGTRPLVAAGAAVATTAFTVVVFRELLLVPLPPGPLGL